MDSQTDRTKVDVGTPPIGFQQWALAEVHFHRFEDLPTENNSETESPEFACLGKQWSMSVFPGGHEDSDDGMVAVFLNNRTNEGIKINYVFAIRNSSRTEVVCMDYEDEIFRPRGGEKQWLGDDNFEKRSTLLKALVDGTLTFQVWMKISDPSKQLEVPFIPANPICKNILKKFLDEDSADVVFEVSSESNDKGKKKRKRGQTTTGTTFHAHRLILQDGAPQLAGLCKPSGRGDPPRITLVHVEPRVFRHMLYYVYGGKLAEEDLDANAKQLIDAADKYGIVNLKLQAEAFYVKSTKLAIDNILDNLLYSYSKNCALLKEAVMDFIIENGDTVMEKVSFNDCPGSAVTDILAAVSRGKEKGDDSSNSGNYNSMRVATLRRMLDEKGLDVDGSRETMVALLKENS